MIQFLGVVEKYRNQSGEWQARCLYRDDETGGEFCSLLHFNEDPSDMESQARASARTAKLLRVKEETTVDKDELSKIPERTKRPVINTPEGETHGDAIR
jgi:hypothetical protein